MLVNEPYNWGKPILGGQMMLWYVEKIIDTLEHIVYSYGAETKMQTGEIAYIRATEEFRVIKLADGDTDKGVRRLMPHLLSIILNENAPDKRMIATG
jgi:hypothetical protein